MMLRRALRPQQPNHATVSYSEQPRRIKDLQVPIHRNHLDPFIRIEGQQVAVVRDEVVRPALVLGVGFNAVT